MTFKENDEIRFEICFLARFQYSDLKRITRKGDTRKIKTQKKKKVQKKKTIVILRKKKL